jgi:hypothetical protein
VYPWRLYLQPASTALDSAWPSTAIADYQGVTLFVSLARVAANILVYFGIQCRS